MLTLSFDLKRELGKAIVDFWIDSSTKYQDVSELIARFGANTTTVIMLEEVWLASDKMVDKTFNLLLNAIAGYITLALEDEFHWIVKNRACEGS